MPFTGLCLRAGKLQQVNLFAMCEDLFLWRYKLLIQFCVQLALYTHHKLLSTYIERKRFDNSEYNVVPRHLIMKKS